MMFVSPSPWCSTVIRLMAPVILTVLCASIALGQAQSDAADLRGFVHDQQNAVVPNATVTARNPATNTSRTVTSNESGFYQILNLPPGDYELTVEAPNFKKA